MKITYIISDINKAVYFEDTAISLREKGVNLSFILINSKDGELDLFLKSNNFLVYYISCSKITQSFFAVRNCIKILKKINPKSVHCHLAMANWIGLCASKLTGIKKRIYTRHSGEPLNINWKEKLIDKIQNKLATEIIAITKIIKQLLLKQGVSEKKIQLIHHGFKLKRFNEINKIEIERLKEEYNPENKQPIIGVIARWMEWKGIHYIISAFQQLIGDYPNAKILLFGANTNGDFSEQIQNALKTLPEDNYQIISFEKNIFNLYHLFDIYIHVPVNKSCEAFGQTYVESLASKCPSIFTLSGIANEFIIDGNNAIVVPYKNSMAILEAMKKLIGEKDLQKSLKKNGIESIKQFNFDNYINKLIDIYE